MTMHGVVIWYSRQEFRAYLHLDHLVGGTCLYSCPDRQYLANHQPLVQFYRRRRKGVTSFRVARHHELRASVSEMAWARKV